MLYSLEHVRHNLRNREGKRVFYLGKGDVLSCEARDFLFRERIPILPAQQAKPDHYQLLGGGVVTEKPEHMTHLNAQVLVSKAHPRIAFRGAIDTLEGELLLCQVEVPDYRQELEELLDFVRDILRREVLEEPLEERPIWGMDNAQIRQRSHHPQAYYGIPHFMPSAQDSMAVLRLNRLRCAVRRAELAAVAAFAPGHRQPEREDILLAMNRLSSLVYLLMLQAKSAASGS